MSVKTAVLIPFFVLLCLLALPLTASAQSDYRLMNLGGQFRLQQGSLLIYDSSEQLARRDLNGDGDMNDSVLHMHDLAARTTLNLGITGAIYVKLDGSLLMFSRSELVVGKDLNGDRDLLDQVLHIHDIATGTTKNLGLESTVFIHEKDWIAFLVRESLQGKDLNGDGDKSDLVVHVYDLSTGVMTNLKRAVADLYPSFILYDHWLMIAVGEAEQGEDLDGDGKKTGAVLEIHDLLTSETHTLVPRITSSQQKLPWGVHEGQVVYLANDVAIHVHDLSSGIEGTLGLPSKYGLFYENPVIFNVEESLLDQDLNGDGDRKDSVVHVHEFSTGSTRNLGISGYYYLAVDGLLSVSVDEASQDVDLNGDGDQDDSVFHLHEVSTGETRNLGISGTSPVISKGWFGCRVIESSQRADLNGDTDMADYVGYVYHFPTGWSLNLGIAVQSIRITGRCVDFDVSELEQNHDLNGDGDMLDVILHVHDLELGVTRNLGLPSFRQFPYVSCPVSHDAFTFLVDEANAAKDLNGDGDMEDPVYHVLDFGSGRIQNLGIAGSSSQNRSGYTVGDWLVLSVSESRQGSDITGDGDLWDDVLYLLERQDLTGLSLPFIRGDSNGDGGLDLADAIHSLFFQFLGGAATCVDAADVDDDGDVVITDVVFLLGYLFRDGPAPGAPFPLCGLDPTFDWLECGDFPYCATP